MAADAPATVRVWDPLVRIGHWVLVGSVIVAWFTRHGGAVHEWAGYVVLAVVGVRTLWGAVGPRHARFTQFVRPPAATLRYAALVARGREPRHLGHNPLGGWMIVALLAAAALAAASGWLYTTDRFWGVEWVEELHEGLANLLFVLAGVHVAGVVVESLRHRENLVAAMVHGRKRAPAPGDRD
ncbi:MAG: cytochrome b/b6 domain-containing protein [Burkholderiales bacterium]|nr:cytochrome b/b6 domain-containing protein [Burkholderiales bacterium]